MKFCKNCILMSSLALSMSATTAWAGGLWLYEAGTPDMGTAVAGRAALARDASTAATNPAGMTRLDRSQIMVGLLGLDVQSKFHGQTSFPSLDGSVETKGNGDNAGIFTPVSSLNYVYAATPDVRIGVSVGSYFGLGMDYGDSWQGRYYVQNGDILTLGINPSVGYKVNDWFSLGGGFTVLYGKLKQEIALNTSPLGARNLNDGKLKIDSDDVGYGYNFGLLFQPAKDSRIGITYRSKVELDFGDVASVDNVPPSAPIWTRLAAMVNNSKLDLTMTIPQAVMVSGYQQLTDKLAVMANVGWQDWSQTGNVSVDMSSDSTSKSTTVDAGYKDTWHGAIGLHYRIAEPWLLMCGLAYDSSPVKNANRSVAMPLDRQVRYGTGAEYDWNKDVTVGLDYTYIDTGKAKIDQNRGPLAGHIVGEYNTNYISAFGLNMNWKF